MPDASFVEIVVPLPLNDPLTYRWPFTDIRPVKGCRVLVPVGGRRVIGLLWGTVSRPGIEEDRLRSVISVLDPSAILPERLLDFYQWAASYYFYPLGLALSESLPPGFFSARKKTVEKIASRPVKEKGARLKLDAWDSGGGFPLTSEQRGCIEELCSLIEGHGFNPVLLHGVTGSGKTEVYLQATRHCIDCGRNVLVLVPEIAMTAQAVGIFNDRFGNQVAVLHSGLTDSQRRDEWWGIKRGKKRIVVGTRSAIFSPISNLGLIVVDEEHDPSYKQEEKFRYNARDLALVRGKMDEAVVVLGSATPSLTSFFNAMSGKYRLISMKGRVAESVLPSVTIIDRRKKDSVTKAKGGSNSPSRGDYWLSDRLKEAIGETLADGEQVLIFLNRRGFATYVFCPECGHVFRCPNCDVSLTWHRHIGLEGVGNGSNFDAGNGVLCCHYCASRYPALPVCPVCHGHAIRARGYGTEKVADELARMFPDARVARLDRDVSSSRRRVEKILKGFRSGSINMLVGTQMVTKGHDFPGLTLVGVLWADMSLNVPEFNAAERTFQLLTQVAGRAGRGKRPGRVLIQSFMPDHYAIALAKEQDFRRFFDKEVKARQELGYPPFGRMINLKLSGRKRAVVEKSAMRCGILSRRVIRQILARGEGVEVLGPAPSPRARIKGRYLYQVLLKSPRLGNLRLICQAVLRERAEFVLPGVRLEVDVDPQSLT